MKLIPLNDVDATELDVFRNLTDVALRSRSEPEAGIYLAESAKVIRRALAAGHEPLSVILEEKWLDSVRPSLDDWPGVPVYVGSSEVLESITGFHVHRGAIAAFRRPPLPSLQDTISGARRIVILDEIMDHTNVGAAFRAVAGLGADVVLVGPTCADPLYRRSVRVSMGTVLQVPWTRLPNWPETRSVLAAEGIHIAALALDDRAVSLDAFCAELPDRLALVLGSEGHGLSREALEHADSIVTIPMAHGVDSLNVASACAVAVWAVRPRTTEPGGSH
ncbi:MAG: TrmH family RNA methyltransferase [Agromyces sp.]